MINLKRIDTNIVDHEGYGAGSGRIMNEEYECPCGKGKVSYEKDDIPGFRDSHVYCDCAECDEKYKFLRGAAVEK